MCHPPRRGCDCPFNSCRPGVTKRCGPRTEFVIARPLEDRIPCDLRDKQQPILLHCCPQSETWHLKKCVMYLAGRIKLVGGLDAPVGRSFVAPDGGATADKCYHLQIPEKHRGPHKTSSRVPCGPRV